ADLIYRLSYLESFAFGSLISAVDPVPILTVFRALKVDVQLYMLVFGESMLNDAVSIVLTSTTLEIADSKMAQFGSWELLKFGISRFLVMFIGSALLGSMIGFISALLFKHMDFRKTPSLELALLLVFAYIPYGLAEAISLSGIPKFYYIDKDRHN
uniref:Cation/H+ exchanger domain-containing protein n=1 Tax=Acrobeloides nanus TaxID=290746 RepID=A0A914DE54_9BILA